MRKFRLKKERGIYFISGLAAVFAAVALVAIFLAPVKPAEAATVKYGPECAGCHETQGLRDSTQTIDCAAGACHGTTNLTQKTGSHQTHLNMSGGRGPGSVTCDTCHGAGASNALHQGHMNGMKNFQYPYVNLSGTAVCDQCHSTQGSFNGVNSTGGSVGAKDNWKTGVYSGTKTLSAGKEKWCAGCHDTAPPTIEGITAKNIAGDNSGYGFFVSGHGLSSGNYDRASIGDMAGNPPAGKNCIDCHDLSKDHITGQDETNTAGQRLEDMVNGLPVTAVMDVCKNCHQVDSGSPASKKVSAHGNDDSTRTGGANTYSKYEPAYFMVKCQQCHDPHSGKLNNASPPSKNLRMIRPDVMINDNTTGNVVLTWTGNSQLPGIDTFDEQDSEPTSTAGNEDDLCGTCHTNSQNQGYPMTKHFGGYGHLAVPVDRRGDRCPDCHRHNYNSDAVYTWNDGFMPGAIKCGTCHPVYMTDPDGRWQISEFGSHQTHFRYYYTKNQPPGNKKSLKGPGILVCDVCHGIGAGDTSDPDKVGQNHHAGHRNGVPSFPVTQATTDTTSLTFTTVCDSCHSKNGVYDGVTAGGPDIGSKGNWYSGVYSGGSSDTLAPGKETWCVGCHDNQPSVIFGVANNVDATNTPVTTVTAPNIAGDRVNYGAFVNGHTKLTGSFDETSINGGNGNPAAARLCTDCHDPKTQHLNSTNDTSMAGQRITVVNGISIPATASLEVVCKACHQNPGGARSASLENQVSEHGNSGEGYRRIEQTMTPIPCQRCHDQHGLNKNSNGRRNLKMVRSDVQVTTSTTSPVVFEYAAGSDSFDESDTVDVDDVCATCHGSPVNPNKPMKRHVGGNHATTDTSSIFFSNPTYAEKREQICTNCHQHNYKIGLPDDTAGASTGFMPRPSIAACTAEQGCHPWSPVTQRSGSHETHFKESLSLDPQSKKGPMLLVCDTCHGIGATPFGQHDGHFNGKVNFLDSSETTLAITNACNNCHSSGGGYDGVNDAVNGSKKNWTNGVYDNTATLNSAKEKWCVGCHDNAPSQIYVDDGTGQATMQAPMVGGDSTSYGAFVSGHNATTAITYDNSTTGDGTGNRGAGKKCATCHNVSLQHLSTIDDTDTTGQRLKSVINSTATGGTVLGVCQTCHTYEKQGLESADPTNLVSLHGNETTINGYGKPIEGPFNIPACVNCHEPHGRNKNSSGIRNMKMIRRDVKRLNETTGDVEFAARLGTNSFDESDTPVADDRDDICATCHLNDSGSTMARHVGGDHRPPPEESMGDDRRGQQSCVDCHRHNYAEDTRTLVNDGFMPSCNMCHGYPPVPTETVPAKGQKREDYPFGGGVHVRHVEELELVCKRCHTSPGRGPTHNQGGPPPKRPFVNVDFYYDVDPLPFTLTTIDNGAGVATETKSTTTTPGRCRVGCHNPKVFKPYLEPTSEGLSNEVTWSVNATYNTVPLACAKCHDSQGKAIDRQKLWSWNGNPNTTATSGTVQYISGHVRADTGIRDDCKRCHYITADNEHKDGKVRVRSAENTGTMITFTGFETSQAVHENFCLSCHDVDGMPGNWSFSKPGNPPPDIETKWKISGAAAHKTGGGAKPNPAQNGGYGCIGGATINGTGCHGTPHGGAKRKLLAPTNVAGKDEEDICFGCHNQDSAGTGIFSGKAGFIKGEQKYFFNETTATYFATVGGGAPDTVNSASGNIFNSSMAGMWFMFRVDSEWAWSQVSAYVSPTQLRLNRDYPGSMLTGQPFLLRARRAAHPTGRKEGKHNTIVESTSSESWNAGETGVLADKRHVECEDCHNPHAAQPDLRPAGTANIGLVNDGAWGVSSTYTAVYSTGGAVFTNGSNIVNGAALDGPAPTWSASGITPGYRIKNNYDRSGRWYTVMAVNSNTQLRISPAWIGSYTPSMAQGGSDYVDYTLAKVTYTRTTTPTLQADLCLKCHSTFGFSSQTGTDTPPLTPSGMYTTNGGLQSVRETEIGMDFNPNQLAHHPVMARGKNQPPSIMQDDMGSGTNYWPTYTAGTVQVAAGTPTIVTGNNTNWLNMGGSGTSTIIPGWKIGFTSNPSTWYDIAGVNSNTQITLTGPAPAQGAGTAYVLGSGLGNAFVPPYGPWARVVCSDCHRSYDVAGPHGSNNKWLLHETSRPLTFQWWYNNTMNTVQPNIVDVGTSRFRRQTFCYNCHRRDVYGDDGLGNNAADNSSIGGASTSRMSRIQHNPEPAGHMFETDVQKNRWGNNGDGTTNDQLLCMSCHGGDSFGGLHGTNARKAYIDFSQDPPVYIGDGSSDNGGNLRGERFLNGATWSAVTRATTNNGVRCWTKKAVDEVNACTKGHGGQEGRQATYNY